MQKKTLELVEGTLDEFLGRSTLFFPSGGQSALTWVEAFAGKSKAKPAFRIPAADTGKELFFGNPELLGRFASVPLPGQVAFLKTLRGTLREHHVEVLYLEVQWSENRTRKIQIQSSANGEILDFDLL